MRRWEDLNSTGSSALVAIENSIASGVGDFVTFDISSSIVSQAAVDTLSSDDEDVLSFNRRNLSIKNLSCSA